MAPSPTATWSLVPAWPAHQQWLAQFLGGGPDYDRGCLPLGPLVLARALRKTFASFTAVDGIDFEVRPGEAFGFLGPNGAGKTSTMRMIACASPVTSGHLRVFDRDPVGCRRTQLSGLRRARAPGVELHEWRDLGRLLLLSPTALLVAPAAIVVAASFSAMALLLTSVVSRREQFDYVMGLLIMPMFLCSGIFFPVSQVPSALRWLFEVVPLYHAVELLRGLTTGRMEPVLLWHLTCLVIRGRRRLSGGDAAPGARACQVASITWLRILRSASARRPASQQSRPCHADTARGASRVRAGGTHSERTR